MSMGWKLMINSWVNFFFLQWDKEMMHPSLFFYVNRCSNFYFKGFFSPLCLIYTSSFVHFPPVWLISPALVWSTCVSLSRPSLCIYMSKFSCKFLMSFVAFWVCSPFCFLDLYAYYWILDFCPCPVWILLLFLDFWPISLPVPIITTELHLLCPLHLHSGKPCS